MMERKLQKYWRKPAHRALNIRIGMEHGTWPQQLVSGHCFLFYKRRKNKNIGPTYFTDLLQRTKVNGFERALCAVTTT